MSPCVPYISYHNVSYLTENQKQFLGRISEHCLESNETMAPPDPGALAKAVKNASRKSAPATDHRRHADVCSRWPTHSGSVETTRDFWNAGFRPAETTRPPVKPTPESIQKFWNEGFEQMPSPLSRPRSGLPNRNGPEQETPCIGKQINAVKRYWNEGLAQQSVESSPPDVAAIKDFWNN